MAAVAEEEGHAAVEGGAAAGLVPGMLMLVCAVKLGAVVTHTEASCISLRVAAGLLRGATRAAEKFAAYASNLVPAGAAPPLTNDIVEPAAKLLAASVFEGPLPGAVGAARELVGRLYGTLPTSAYEQIHMSQRDLGRLVAVHLDAGGLFAGCAGLLGLDSGDARWQRWRGLHVHGMVQAMHAEERLAATYLDAMDADWLLRTLCSEAESTPGRAARLSWAEEILGDAIEQMDGALLAMRLMRHAVTQEFFEAWMAVLQHQA